MPPQSISGYALPVCSELFIQPTDSGCWAICLETSSRSRSWICRAGIGIVFQSHQKQSRTGAWLPITQRTTSSGPRQPTYLSCLDLKDLVPLIFMQTLKGLTSGQQMNKYYLNAKCAPLPLSVQALNAVKKKSNFDGEVQFHLKILLPC